MGERADSGTSEPHAMIPVREGTARRTSMNIFDPHIHMYARVTDDYERMQLAGIRATIEPAFWLG